MDLFLLVTRYFSFDDYIISYRRLMVTNDLLIRWCLWCFFDKMSDDILITRHTCCGAYEYIYIYMLQDDRRSIRRFYCIDKSLKEKCITF